MYNNTVNWVGVILLSCIIIAQLFWIHRLRKSYEQMQKQLAIQTKAYNEKNNYVKML